jgi:aromatic-L-amino-acid decarboxylase
MPPAAHNAALAAALTADGRVLLAAATVDGVPCLRACIVNHRTTEDDVRAIVAVVRELGARVGTMG